MSHVRRLSMLGVFAMLGVLGQLNAGAEDGEGIKTVFVIAMENHNWTQPANQFTGGIQQIFQNPAAPFINSLVNGTAVAKVNGRDVRISEHLAFAANYHNVLATPAGNNPHIHPSEPNYLWAEAGTNFGILNDNDPFSAVNPSNQNTNQHLATLLTQAGRSWRSYQEDTDLTTVGGQLTNVPLPRDQWTVPLKSISGVFAPGNFNQFNGSNQFNYAAKHNPQVFFTDSNGGNDATTANPLRFQYAPLQQLFTDLANNTVADYNYITPNQFNDMHTTLTGGYKGLTGDPAKILQGDDFLRQIIPVIMASKAYKEHGAIIIWFDESEQDAVGDNPDDFNHTIGEIVISERAHKNVHGVPYASPLNFTHSSDLRTMQEIFRTGGPFLGDAANAIDLSDLFERGVIRNREKDDDGRDRD
ncbi:MAG TPA: alkaline phosphatase family protein [Candidatus Angelobacter sp.]|nr:alkaline phosphatase family protein [Candidatus Angelobacter sp.]